MFWRDIACLTTTKPMAAHELLLACVNGCGGGGETDVLGSMAKLLRVGAGNHDLQYCVLASFFHAVQANQNQSEPASLLHPSVLGPLSNAVQKAAEFTASRFDMQLRVRVVGPRCRSRCLNAWSTIW